MKINLCILITEPNSALDTWTVIEAVFYRQRFVTFGCFKLLFWLEFEFTQC